MDQAELEFSPVANAIVLLVMLGSLVALGAWIHRWATRGYVLACEPRQPVPWGISAALPAIIMTMLGVANLIAMRNEPPVDFEVDQFLEAQLMTIGLNFLFFIAVLAVLSVSTSANQRDLGLPRSGIQLVDDIGLGLWVGLASMIPIYATQYAAIVLLEIDPSHPLIDQMQAIPDVRVFIAAGLSAVVVAPFLEEVLFRLLMQGGLERWEEQLTMPSAESPTADSELDAPQQEPLNEPYSRSLPPDEPPPALPYRSGVFPGLATGWAPILISSFVFALAHLGAGPSPIPLFVFALFLGYVYQRTHRIVPCIVAHMLLNATSIGLLVLSIGDS